jgi:hypothetical protein
MRWKAGEDMSLELEIMTECMSHSLMCMFLYVILTHGFVLLIHTTSESYKLLEVEPS